MARVTVEDCLRNVDSRFTLVHLAVRRVLQLRGGAPYLVDAPKNKEVVVALREIAARKVTLENVRQLEETRGTLPEPPAPSPEKQTETALELKEVMEAATQYDASMEYNEQEQIIEPEAE